MSQLTALRLYFSHSAKAKPSRFWHRIVPPALGHSIVKSAHRSGIQQVLSHSVHSGYLQGNKPSIQTTEVHAKHHPHCIELIDAESKLRTFLKQHADELKNVHVVLFRCELAQ